MHEVELKSVVDDMTVRRSLVEAAGGRLVYSGRLLDVRYDLPDRSMVVRDHVLRVRVYETAAGSQASLDWKGETRYEKGFKVREEISSSTGDPSALAGILERLGYVVAMKIDRHIAQYDLHGAVVRFEEYPDMDTLVEVEGSPAAIEQAIEAIGLPRNGFTAERLLEFVIRFEARTGRKAIISAPALG